MAFGIGTNAENTDSGKLAGRKLPVAVDCWFTSKGDTIPRMLKYQDEEGDIRCISEIRLLRRDEKRYCGIASLEYRCEIVQDGRKQEIRLLFLSEEHRWMLSFQ